MYNICKTINNNNNKMKKSAEIRSQIDAKLADLVTLNDTEGKTLTDETRSGFEGKYNALKSEIEQLKKDEKRELDMETIREEAATSQKRAIDLSNASGNGTKDKEEGEVKKRFSMSNFIQEAGEGKLTGINAELDAEARSRAKKDGTNISGFGLPAMIVGASGKRSMTAGTDTAGGYTVPNEVMTIVDYLYNKSVLRAAGADFLTGLSGDFYFPVRDNAISSDSLAEVAQSSEKSPTFTQKPMSPKRIGSYIDMSNQLIAQSNASIDSYITRELGQSILVDMENLAINGTGSSNQPTGILNTSGIGSVALGTNGGPITWEAVVLLATKIAEKNADLGALNYLTNAQVRGAMQTVEKATGTAQFILNEAMSLLNGYGLQISQNVPSNLTKGTASGVCSAMIYGNFNDLKIGQWGGIDILVDKYTRSTYGETRVTVNGYFDTLVLRPESFAAITDITTS